MDNCLIIILKLVFGSQLTKNSNALLLQDACGSRSRVVSAERERERTT